MPRYKLTLEYDGTGLAGWQRQTNVPSAQQHLEEAIFAYCQDETSIIAAGRTDAGVHARGQVVHADLSIDRDLYSIRQGLNYHLENKPVVVLEVEKVDDDFHARFSAKKRYYRYSIVNRPSVLVLERDRAWHLYQKLDLRAMVTASQYLIGHHDFSSFRAAGCQASGPVKTLDTLDIRRQDDQIIFEVSAQSFLYHMVRNLVGTLAEVGMGERKPADVWKILQAKDRAVAGQTAPACGLYFMKVEY